MSQSIQQRIEAAVHSRLPADQPVSRMALSESGLPEGIRHFLLQTLDRRVHLESSRLLQHGSGWIDPSHPATGPLADHVAEQLKAAGQFPADEWNKAMPQAVEALMAYLQEPARALADFAFTADSSTLPASDLRRRTGYFCDYPYMARAVDAWLQKRDEQEIDRTAFESAMRHLDCRLTADYSDHQWVALLQPLVSVVQFAGIQPAGLPVPMVVRFFEAKDRPAIATLIRQAASVHRAEMITMPSLQDIIRKAFENERLQAEETPESAAEPETSTADAPTPDAPSAPDNEQQASTDQPMPLWKRFQQRVDGPAKTEADTRETPSPQPLWKSFEQGEAPASAASAAEADKIPIKEAPRVEAQHIVLGTAVRSRDRFIRDLFDGDEDMFTDVMEQLSEAPDWTQASAIIAERIFRPYRVDIYSGVAVDFTNAVEARYSGQPS